MKYPAFLRGDIYYVRQLRYRGAINFSAPYALRKMRCSYVAKKRSGSAAHRRTDCMPRTLCSPENAPLLCYEEEKRLSGASPDRLKRRGMNV